MDLAKTDRTPLEIIAHESAVTCLALNIQGTRLATAGERGTLIRIFDTTDGTKLAELRRGTHHVCIYSIYEKSFFGLTHDNKFIPHLSVYRPEFIASISTWNQRKFACHPIMVPSIFSTLKKHEQKNKVCKSYRNISQANGRSANFQCHKERQAFGTFNILDSNRLMYKLKKKSHMICLLIFYSAFGPDGNSVIGKSKLRNQFFFRKKNRV